VKYGTHFLDPPGGVGAWRLRTKGKLLSIAGQCARAPIPFGHQLDNYWTYLFKSLECLSCYGLVWALAYRLVPITLDVRSQIDTAQ
jgi:hypothetical protein